jgi:hypothetical protein
MSTFRILEEDHGTTTGSRHPHNGYYAGDFTDEDGRTGRLPFRVGSVICTTLHPSEHRAA